MARIEGFSCLSLPHHHLCLLRDMDLMDLMERREKVEEEIIGDTSILST